MLAILASVGGALFSELVEPNPEADIPRDVDDFERYYIFAEQSRRWRLTQRKHLLVLVVTVTEDAVTRRKGKIMAEDWAADVKKYASNADEKVIAGIVRYCGIALQQRDSSLVSFADKEEVARVRENFLKKKLGLTNSDTELDQAITAVAAKMKGDRTKNRVTVYYLLAEHFGKLSTFA